MTEHIHNIYDMYLFLEQHRNECSLCKKFQDVVIGNFIEMAEFLVEEQVVSNQ